jgi:GH25 family lysozyme M1 (1,4-beta-N-acetylmuramidase)
MRPRSLLVALAAIVLAFVGSTVSTEASANVRPAAVPGLPGFDISGAESDVDWGAAAANGAKFVFITATEGTTHQYPNVGRLSAGAHGAGLVTGAAHFALPNASGGAAQADYFAAHGGAWSADHRTLPGTLDIEYNPYGATCYGLGQNAMEGWISDFTAEYHARTGRWAIIYTTASWWNTCVGDGGAFGAKDPLFVAGYGGTPAPPTGWSTYAFWQYAASGVFPGGQDVFNGTAAALTALADNT